MILKNKKVLPIVIWVILLLLGFSSVVFLYVVFKGNKYYRDVDFSAYYCIWGVYLLVSLFLFIIGSNVKAKTVLKHFLLVIGLFSFIIAIVVTYGFHYYISNYSTVKMDEFVWAFNTNLSGTNVNIFLPTIVKAVAAVIAFSIIFVVCFRMLDKKEKAYRFGAWILLTALMLQLRGIALFYKQLDVGEFIFNLNAYSPFIEDNWVDSRNVKISFPEKRNLIYIYLESVETTFADFEHGGAMEENYIPELTEIGLENICFGDGKKLNGGYSMPDTTYTMGAMAGMTAGIGVKEDLFTHDRVNETWNGNEVDYLPGVYALGDILADNGYEQELMVGSDANFGGRATYYKNHGNYKICDYYTAIEDGIIDKSHYVWWGMEDKYLFEYAKKEITRLAGDDKPFNFSMLTVDTHFTGGYVCDLCGNDYREQYSNVYACSSKQVSEFVDWIKQQDFYENTTIILAGDHPTMDAGYIERENVPQDYQRKAYLAILNPAEGCQNSERTYTTIDLFPTTLAAIGAKIDGNRLGLGTNLFSDERTLIEEYGYEDYRVKLKKWSKFYENELAKYSK